MPTIWFVMSNAEPSPSRLRQRKAHVDDDEPVDTHALREFDGQVVDETAIHQQAAIPLDRRENARSRHACAQDGHQVALLP